MRHSLALLACLVAFALAGPGCSKKTASPELGTETGTAAGVQWKVPKHWSVASQRPMRVVTYTISPAGNDTAAAECAVSFFGAGQGGPVEMNIERWKGQFENPDASTPASREVSGVKITTVRITGTYLSPGGMMMSPGEPKPEYGMIGAVVEAPEGMLFFKMTGPKGTVISAEAEFNALLDSITK